MSDLIAALKAGGSGLQTVIQVALLWVVWRIKTNDLPHIHDVLARLDERTKNRRQR